MTKVISALETLGAASALALLASCGAPVTVEPADPTEPAESRSSHPVLGTWLPAVVHRVEANGETIPANDWDAILWLPMYPPRDGSHHFHSSASDYLSSVGTASEHAAIVTLFAPRDRPHLTLGAAELSAPGAPPTRPIPVKSFGGFYQPSHLLAFPPLDPTWHELELRVPVAGGGGIVVQLVRPSTCDDFVSQYRKVLDWGSGSCNVDTDCSTYGGLDSANICSHATDHRTMRKLRLIRDAAVAGQCPRPYSCTTTTARCVEGGCQR